MHNVFIAWGGNCSLANEIKKILQSDKFNIIVGGGSPTDLFVGAQVIDQINQCDCAILLVEDHNGQISPNLFFEWGYILANKDIRNQNIQIYMIDKSPRDLPSDLLGVWVNEMTREAGDDNGDKKLAEQISKKFLSLIDSENNLDYFTIINNWTNLRQNFAEKKKRLSEREFEEKVVIGCLAAYYYNDYKYLYDELSKVTGSADFNSTILFARTYIEVFLKSDNMTKEISTKDFFKFAEIFQIFLNKYGEASDNFEKLIAILCNDVYGLSCLLYLKNDDLDDIVKEECKKQALTCFENTLTLTDELEKVLKENKCLLHLIRAYIYNDTAHLYAWYFNNTEEFLDYLDKSVTERKNLHLTFCSKYPNNKYIANKLEQEYMIALSEKCKYMNNDFQRTISISTIKSKYEEWKADIDYISSLVRRLENNIKALNK